MRKGSTAKCNWETLAYTIGSLARIPHRQFSCAVLCGLMGQPSYKSPVTYLNTIWKKNCKYKASKSELRIAAPAKKKKKKVWALYMGRLLLNGATVCPTVKGTTWLATYKYASTLNSICPSIALSFSSRSSHYSVGLRIPSFQILSIIIFRPHSTSYNLLRFKMSSNRRIHQ
jgi:hypothetical protein